MGVMHGFDVISEPKIKTNTPRPELSPEAKARIEREHAEEKDVFSDMAQLQAEALQKKPSDGWREGVKFDHGKAPWHLLPWDAVRAIVWVLMFGAKKYSDRNWELGMDWSRPFAALMRHMTAWWEGEAKDPETGYSHLWHAGCCILFLIAFELRGIGHDDRPVQSSGGTCGKQP